MPMPKNMHDIHVSLPGNIFARIISDRSAVGDNRMQRMAQAYVPGIVFLRQKPRRTDITLEHRESANKRMRQRENRVLLYDRWTDFSNDIWHLLYSMLRAKLLEKHLYPVHAACIATARGGILLVGHSGMGKTSIVMGLAKNPDVQVFSGNKTIVSFENDVLWAVAGTRTITMRTVDLQRHAFRASEAVRYGNRTAFVLEIEKYATAATQIPIRAITIIRLNDGAEECLKLSPLNAPHTLYAYFLDTVNADAVLCGGKEVFAGDVSKDSRRHLSQMLRKALLKISAYVINGSLPFVVAAVSKLQHQLKITLH